MTRMDKREKSRQEWEQEIRRRQQNITPANFPEGVHHARIPGLPKIKSQARFWLGIVLIGVGANVFRSTIAAATAIAATTVVLGLIVAISAMR